MGRAERPGTGTQMQAQELRHNRFPGNHTTPTVKSRVGVSKVLDQSTFPSSALGEMPGSADGVLDSFFSICSRPDPFSF